MADTDSKTTDSSPAGEATLVSREPWWAAPPMPGQDELEVKWGWLELYADGHFNFDDTRPTDDEIKNRPGCHLGD